MMIDLSDGRQNHQGVLSGSQTVCEQGGAAEERVRIITTSAPPCEQQPPGPERPPRGQPGGGVQ